MQFSAPEGFEVPIDMDFTMIADSGRFERMAIRRGRKVRCTVNYASPQAGTSWETELEIRGKLRRISVAQTECETPSLMRLQTSGKGMNKKQHYCYLILT